ncbi:MAG: helix-turn-helix domain-containing protein [Hyphomicrobiales bacterium]
MIAIRTIKQAVADYYGFSERDLEGPWQSARLVRARQVAIYLAREITMQSLPSIARAFGDRDHSTVMRGIARIKAALGEDEGLRGELAALRERLGADETDGATEIEP